MMKFTSTKLISNLEGVRDKLAGRKMSARIVVPPDLDWWFYQEFGTATHFDTGSYALPPNITEATLPSTTAPQGYTIPVRYGGLLRLPITVEFPIAWEGQSVHHPGVSPKAFIRSILPDIHQIAVDAVVGALVTNEYSPDAVQDVLMQEVMPAIVTAITDSMSQVLGDAVERDTPGKLGLTSPSAAFESAVTIVDSSG